MDHTPEQQALRERYVITLIEAASPLMQEATDPEITLELLIEAANLLKQHLENELQELRQEGD
jgi:ribosomal protein S15P/S13E